MIVSRRRQVIVDMDTVLWSDTLEVIHMWKMY